MNSQRCDLKMKRNKILAALLYVLPIVFFTVAYFGITASGEDIYQGAGNYKNGVEINVTEDAAEAFRHNGRITDVYAWTVIDFFDYQFQWGPDAIFRLLDVAMACGVFYLMTMAIIGRKPKLSIRDALVYDASFAIVMLTQHGRVFYAGFSAIHNYMVGAFIMMAFATPYLMMLWESKVGERYRLVWAAGMVIAGVLFGMSSAIAPIAFVIIAIIYGIAIRKRRKTWMPKWAIAGIVGTIVGICVSNFAGPGLDFYTSNGAYVDTYDYVSVVGFFGAPLDGMVRLLKHLAMNFGRVLVPIVICLAAALICIRDARQVLTKKFWREMSKKRKKVLVACVMFAVIAILGTVQVNAPLRILLPAYIASVMAALITIEPCIKSKTVGWAIILVVGAIVITKIGLTVEYHQRASEVFDEVRKNDAATICVDREIIRAKNLPVVYLGQEDMLAEWAMPEVVYNKTVKFCE